MAGRIPEYPRIPRILFHKSLWLVESRDDPEYARVSQDSEDTIPPGSIWLEKSWDNPEYPRIPRILFHQGLTRVYMAGGIPG